MSAGSEVSGAASVSQISSDNSRSGSAPRNSVRFADDNTIGYSALAAGAAVAGGAALATHSNSKQRQEKVPSLAGNVARSSVSLDRDDRNNMDFSAGDQYISNGMGSDLAARNTARNAAILPIGNNEAPISKLGNVRSSASASDNRIGNLQGASASGISNRDAAFLAGGVGAGAIAGAAVANSGNAAPKTAGNVRKQTTQTTTSIRQTSTTRNYVASAVGSGADGSKSLPSAPVQHTGAVPLAAVATSNGSDSNELEEDGFAPPAPTSHVVTDPYFPTRPDEMRLHPGDLIGIQVIYSDHWARGQNISQGRRRVVFPLSHVVPMKNGPSQTPKGSWSTQHSNESNPPSKKPVSERTTSLAKQL